MRMQTAKETLNRFLDKVFTEPNTGCWFWTGALARGGYGMLTVNKIQRYAHRFSYEINNGPISNGLVIDHLCRVHCCVNPRHLRAVTQFENVHAPGSLARATQNKGKVRCQNGHEFDSDSQYVDPHGKKRRVCRICERASNKLKYIKKKQRGT